MNPSRLESWAGVPVCVVGGTGFLGFQIVRRLLARNARVRVLAFPPPPGHPLHQMPEVELRTGDIRDPVAVADAVRGCRVVFQAAGPVAVGTADRAAALDPHTAGTRTLLDHLPAGCRLVHTSSLVAVGGTRDGAVLREDSPFPLGGLKIEYVRAKRAAEEVALGAGKDVIAVNPGYLIGPDDFSGSVMGRFCTRFWRGRIPIAPPGGFNFIDVRDAAEGHVLAAERGVAGERYVVGGENLPIREFLRLAGEVAGFRPRALPAVGGLPYLALAAAAELRAKLTGKEPFPSFEHVRLNRYFWYATSDKATRDLGFAARSVRESLADAFRWHHARQPLRPRGLNGWLMRPPGVRSAPAR